MSSIVRRRSGLYVPRAGAATYRAAVLADTPAGYWRLGEGSGTAAADSSGNNHGGTYVGSPTLGTTGLVTADTDTAVTLNGTTQYVSVTYGSWMVPPGDSFSIDAIIKPSAITGFQVIAARWGPDATSRPWAFGINSGKLGMFFASGSSVTGATTLIAGTKYHVASVYSWSAGTITVYVNGVQDGITTGSSVPHNFTSPLLMGARDIGGSPTSFLPGVEDEVAYYLAALSGTRIAAHAALV